VRHAGDVQAAGRHVGGDQHVDLARAEGPQRPFPGALAEVSMDRRDREAPEVQFLGGPVRGPLRPGEDHR
jgi:hypothetical protein